MHDSAHALLITAVSALAGGVLLMVAARRLGLPAIVLLLVGGLALGPFGAGLVQPEALGYGLSPVVSLCVGLILFEGGLNLDIAGFRAAPAVIRRLLTIGVLVTWMGVATTLWLVAGLPSFFDGMVVASLVIVTGPTVIAPLLRRIRVTERLSHILHWEGVLIDPIGVFIALLCFEGLVQESGGMAFADLSLRVVSGMVFGLMGGWLIQFCLVRRLVPHDMINMFILGMAVLIFGAAEALISEAGLLSVTVAGFLLGVQHPPWLKEIRAFKTEIAEICIGTLFMLLAARLDPATFANFGVGGFLSVAVVMVVIRPISVTLCTWGLGLSVKERAFLGWVAPRGIVAASMASLFAITLENSPGDAGLDPAFVETFTWSVIAGTIIVQGLSAGMVARWLGLQRPDPTGWLVVGAHDLGRSVARFLSSKGISVVIMDTDRRRTHRAAEEGLIAIEGDARAHDEVEHHPALQQVGFVLAITDNPDLNYVICQRWSEELGPDHVYRWQPPAPARGETSHVEGGRPVWAGLPRPSLLGAELSNGEARLAIRMASEDNTVEVPGQPLLWVHEGAVGVTATDKPATGATILSVDREADFLLRSLHHELVLTLDDETPEQVLRQMMESVVQRHPHVPLPTVIQDLLEREQGMPSALGHEVAVPHAYVPNLQRRICVLARLQHGVSWQAPDGEPVRLVFLLLSPQGDPDGHLATLADVARLVLKEEMRSQLLSLEDAEKVVDVIWDAHRSG
ncbi:MAG: cation:proton antiporter [Bradymonadia bacterium]